MGRNVYRIYLYVVVIGALANVAYWWYNLLHIAFLATPTGADQAPARAVYQAIVATALSLLLGGLHYGWIRKDIAEDSVAGPGLVRAVALNLTQALAAVAALVSGVLTLEQIDQVLGLTPPSSTTQWPATLAIFIVTGVAFLLLQFERQSIPPARGAPLTAQRAHLYLVQSIALLEAFLSWRGAIAHLTTNTQGQSLALGPVLGGYALATLFAAEVWLLYFFLARGDMPSVLRFAMQLFGFTFGVLSTIAGEWGAVSNVIGGQGNTGGEPIRVLAAPHNFVAFLVFGVLTMIGYGFWMVREADRNGMERPVTELTVLAVSALVLGVAFYVGTTMGLAFFVHDLFRQPGDPDNAALWVAMRTSAIGLLLGGLAHPLMALVLRERSLKLSPDLRLPRQGFVLAALAAGFLTIAFAFVLLQINIASPNQPPVRNPVPQLENIPRAFANAWNAFWSTLMKCTGNCSAPPNSTPPSSATLLSFVPPLVVATVLVGLFIAVTHLWFAFREGWLPHLRSPAQPLLPQEAGSPAAAEARGDFSALESIVDDVVEGRITRQQAIERFELLARGEQPVAAVHATSARADGTFDT